MRCRGTTSGVLIVVAAGPGVAAAEPRSLDVGAFVGVDHFGDDIELGNAWASDQVPGTSALVGARVGTLLLPDLAPSSLFDPSIGIELEARMAMASTGSDVEEDRGIYFSPVFGWRVQGVARLDWSDEPYGFHAVVGFGGETVVTGSPFMADETDPIAYWGPGAVWKFSPDWNLRLDLRHGLTAGRTSSVVSTLEVQVGLEHRFHLGGAAAPKKERAREDERQRPIDPAGDSDGDGVANAKDECQLDAEDKDGFLDQDGCPEPDNDGDSLFDAADQCPLAAEDMDGTADQDGCPDEDNDGDGVADKVDTCPDAAETKNSFMDEDGCPDELPAEVLGLGEVGKQIVFEKKKAKLKEAGKTALDGVAAVLAKHPAVRIRILGYTNELPGDKGKDLSRRRADAAKWYLADEGVAADRIAIEGRGKADAPGQPKNGLVIELVRSADGAAKPEAPKP